MKTNVILQGDALAILKTLPDESIDCCITSPPYWGLRDYGVKGQLGLEKTPDLFVENMVTIFSEVRRVLRRDGTLWLNLGDSYCGTSSKGTYRDPKYKDGRNGQGISLNARVHGIKSKDLIGIPWMLAFALRSAGWYLRQDIIWHKPNPHTRKRYRSLHESARVRFLAREVERVLLRRRCNTRAGQRVFDRATQPRHQRPPQKYKWCARSEAALDE